MLGERGLITFVIETHGKIDVIKIARQFLVWFVSH